ncbi:MAG TPA: Flp pilus assembly protein CpaB [Candidatus Limnocylindrales bacterium]|jgi:Flp pilus assembly protein CpaB
MELEFKNPRRRWRLLIVLGVILALGAGGAVYYLINQAQQQAATGGGPPKVAVVVAARAIPARKAIESGDVTIQQVPLDASTSAGTLDSVDKAIGRVTAVAILPNQIVTTNLLASQTEGAKFSILDPTETVGPDSPAWRAISLTATDQNAAAGLIQPGDTVDVILTVPVNVPVPVTTLGRFYADASTKVTYQNLVVLARATSFYVLKATLPVAEEIGHLQASANVTFTLALRPPQDTRVVDVSALGSTTNRIIQKYGLPIPELYPPATGPFTTPGPVVPPTPPPAATPTPQAPAPSPSG